MTKMGEYRNHMHQVLTSVQTNILRVQEVAMTRAITGWTPVPIPTKSGTVNTYKRKRQVSFVEPTGVPKKRNKFELATSDSASSSSQPKPSVPRSPSEEKKGREE
ncbi:hypothetical protein PHYPSEUDO_013065 [Phytophthora pseudosyringae]|uniref:Uncharacterized protein n=1 Tax=Phytophthora pseudosyringae TaxID=221518 RepID=A0A8T1W3Z7_9STRA|nr:hypothetical protein PHYPSEUDO_013065 [Phytophthora pseudosyringae]